MAANRKASAQSRKSEKPATNRPVSFEQATLLCPTQGQAERVAERFGLAVPDYQAIRELHARALHDMADGLAGALNDQATQMHFQRIVGSPEMGNRRRRRAAAACCHLRSGGSRRVAEQLPRLGSRVRIPSPACRTCSSRTGRRHGR